MNYPKSKKMMAKEMPVKKTGKKVAKKKGGK